MCIKTNLTDPNLFNCLTYDERLGCALKMIFLTDYSINKISSIVLPDRYVSDFAAIFILKYGISPELLRGYIWTERFNGCTDLSKSKNEKVAQLYLLLDDIDLACLKGL